MSSSENPSVRQQVAINQLIKKHFLDLAEAQSPASQTYLIYPHLSGKNMARIETDRWIESKQIIGAG